VQVLTASGPSMQTISNPFATLDRSCQRGNGILMLDDVFTTSETARACRDILKKRSGCRGVIGLFVGTIDYD